MNAHERAHRAEKVARIVAALANCGPITPELLEFMRLQPAEWWADLADAAGVHPPSAKTIALVIEVFERRVSEDELLDQVMS